MTTANAYIEQVLRLIWASEEKRARLEADLRSHFAEGRAQGEGDTEVISRLGSPESVAEEFMRDIELETAGLFERLFAFVSDVGLAFTLSLPLVGLCAVLAPLLESPEPQVLGFAAIAFVGLTAAGWVLALLLYFPLLEAHFGKTLGKHLMQLRVRTDQGAQVGLGAAFLRRLSLYFEILFLDALFVPFTAKNQRAFDIVAGTLVLREGNAPASASRYLMSLATWLPPVLVVIALLTLAPSGWID